MLTAIPCTLMRGGTSKGLYFHGDDLPAERPLLDHVLLAAMGSPDLRQIDGVGGAHPDQRIVAEQALKNQRKVGGIGQHLGHHLAGPPNRAPVAAGQHFQ